MSPRRVKAKYVIAAGSVGTGVSEVFLYTMDIVDRFDIDIRSTRLA